MEENITINRATIKLEKMNVAVVAVLKGIAVYVAHNAPIVV